MDFSVAVQMLTMPRFSPIHSTLLDYFHQPRTSAFVQMLMRPQFCQLCNIQENCNDLIPTTHYQMLYTNLINSIRCNCCKWKYKYRSLSNNSGCNWLTRCVASWTRPLCTASLINIRLSRVFNSTVGSTPASDWNFSAASLNPSVKHNTFKQRKYFNQSTHKKNNECLQTNRK